MNSGKRDSGRGAAALKRLAVILIGGCALAIAFFTIYALYTRNAYRDKIFPGVRVSGVSLSGLTKSEAESLLRERLTFPFAKAFAFHYGDDVWHGIPDDLGMQIQYTATVENAFKYGRGADELLNMRHQVKALMTGKNFEPVLLFDERVAFNFITGMAQYIDIPMEQPSITLQGKSVEIEAGKSGRLLDRAMTMTMLEMLAKSMRTTDLDLPVVTLETTADNLAEKKAQLEHILTNDFTLYISAGNGLHPVDTISGELLAGWIDFTPLIHRGEITIEMTIKRNPFYNRLVALSVDLYQKPQNARFIFNDDTRIIEPFAEAVVGQELDLEASLKNIQAAIQSGRSNAELVLKMTEPEIRSDANGAELGITELAFSQYTYFYGSSPERVQNIVAGSAPFHGMLIKSGETFSMAENIGDINIDNGFAEAAVIYGNETIQGVGGGICQVSTTLFRTALNYGLPIKERHQHAYRVFYYERMANGNIDPNLSGLDASVFFPVLDLKFTNDTPYWILMEVYVNREAYSIQWKFYSTKVNRYVELKTTGPTNLTEPEDPIYRENPKLSTGVIEQVDYEIKGADVDIVRTVYEDGLVHLQDRFVTNYRPWQAIYEYGPGTPNIPTPKPPDEPGE